MTEEVVAIIPQPDPHRVLEVTYSDAGSAELRQLAWGEGVGWYRLNTLQLDGEATRTLVDVLLAAEAKASARARGTDEGRVVDLASARREREARSRTRRAKPAPFRAGNTGP